MQSTSSNKTAALLAISDEHTRQRAREIVRPTFFAKHKPTSLVVALTDAQLAILERVVNKLLAETGISGSRRQVVQLDEFAASARQLAALSVTIRHPSKVRYGACLFVPELGAVEIAAANSQSSYHPSVTGITLSWRDPFWVLDIFAPVSSPHSQAATMGRKGRKPKVRKKSAYQERPSPEQRTLAVEKAKRARAARDAARRAAPNYEFDTLYEWTKKRREAMKQGLIAGKRDPAAGSQILRSNAKVVSGGLPGLGKRR